MISPYLQKAIDNLHIHDVYLKNFVARCIDDFDPKYYANSASLVVQNKHQVKQTRIIELDGDVKLLQVILELGARWVDDPSPGEENSIKAEIEAEFIAEYVMEEPLVKESLDEFALKNASYHVWPYWRELLSNQCTRMRLPIVVLPMVQLAQNHNVEQSADDAINESSD